MNLDKIELLNFRNYQNIEISFSKHVNIIYGDNANGKTNLLEAIYYLSILKSFKSKSQADLIRFNQEYSIITGRFNTINRQLTSQLSFNKKHKTIKVNDVAINNYHDYLGLSNVVLFVPEDLLLIKGSPLLRRRFLNLEIAKLYPKYFDCLLRYQKALKEKNIILKKNHIDHTLLDVLDLQLASLNFEIVKERQDFIHKLNEKVNLIHQSLSQSKDQLELVYQTTLTSSIQEILEQLNKSRHQDIARKTSQIGCHRDDISFKLNGMDASLYASQGQIRTIILALKLGIVVHIKEVIKEYPILLLDDVFSELDDHRQNQLLRWFNGRIQTFITTTSLFKLEQLSNYHLYKVTNGIIKEEYHD